MKEGHLEGVTLTVVKESDSQKHVTQQNIPEIVWRVALHDSVWEATKKSRGTLLGMGMIQRRVDIFLLSPKGRQAKRLRASVGHVTPQSEKAPVHVSVQSRGTRRKCHAGYEQPRKG